MIKMIFPVELFRFKLKEIQEESTVKLILITTYSFFSSILFALNISFKNV